MVLASKIFFIIGRYTLFQGNLNKVIDWQVCKKLVQMQKNPPSQFDFVGARPCGLR